MSFTLICECVTTLQEPSADASADATRTWAMRTCAAQCAQREEEPQARAEVHLALRR